MPRFPQPCSVCGKLTGGASLCDFHTRERNRQKEAGRVQRGVREKKSRLYNYAYRKAAQELKATATHCHICHQPFKEGDRVEADHLIAGSNEGGIAAAHRICNQQRGARPL